MSDANKTQPLSSPRGSDGFRSGGTSMAPENAGHGKHRGPVSSHDGEETPSGRHRKPVEETGAAR
ncbi:hypothetical protein [Streptomyces sp. NPDC046197]|uniref:hypothetical protein n=1 Tax=Streptomyces sp. NPDC046197 TaxID=3154337 RepID=UPI0033F32A05